MRVNLKIFITVISIILVTMVSSCIKEELEDLPPSVKGQIFLTTDWSQRELGVPIPSNYFVMLNNETYLFEQISNTLPAMDAGNYRLYVYNTPPNIEIKGTVARVNVVDGVISDVPEHFFTSALDVVYQDNKVLNYTAVMKQQTGVLNFELDIEEIVAKRVKKLKSRLEGIGNQLDMETGAIEGDGAIEIIIDLEKSLKTRTTSAIDSSFFITFHLLGIGNRPQILSFDIILDDGTILRSQSDMSRFLQNFNDSKNIPLNLKGVIPHTSVEVGTVVGIVTDWKHVEGGSAIVN